MAQPSARLEAELTVPPALYPWRARFIASLDLSSRSLVRNVFLGPMPLDEVLAAGFFSGTGLDFSAGLTSLGYGFSLPSPTTLDSPGLSLGTSGLAAGATLGLGVDAETGDAERIVGLETLTGSDGVVGVVVAGRGLPTAF